MSSRNLFIFAGAFIICLSFALTVARMCLDDAAKKQGPTSWIGSPLVWLFELVARLCGLLILLAGIFG